MTPIAMHPLVDTDIFCKLGVCGLLQGALSLFGGTIVEAGRLPALPHMLRRGRLPKLYGAGACAKLCEIAELMPAAPVASTAWLERLAGIPLIDPGEAQLFASAAEHSLTILSGDKRALGAIATVKGLPEALARRIVTLEAVLIALCEKHGDEHVRSSVAPVLVSERMVQVCFSSATARPREGLQSYFDHLKGEVQPLVLWDPAAEWR